MKKWIPILALAALVSACASYNGFSKQGASMEQVSAQYDKCVKQSMGMFDTSIDKQKVKKCMNEAGYQ